MSPSTLVFHCTAVSADGRLKIDLDARRTTGESTDHQLVGLGPGGGVDEIESLAGGARLDVVDDRVGRDAARACVEQVEVEVGLNAGFRLAPTERDADLAHRRGRSAGRSRWFRDPPGRSRGTSAHRSQ